MPRGTPEAANAAAPMRRRLCQVKAHQGEPARSERRECCWDCFEGKKAPPAEVAVTGAREAHRAAQAADHLLVGE